MKWEYTNIEKYKVSLYNHGYFHTLYTYSRINEVIYETVSVVTRHFIRNYSHVHNPQSHQSNTWWYMKLKRVLHIRPCGVWSPRSSTSPSRRYRIGKQLKYQQGNYGNQSHLHEIRRLHNVTRDNIPLDRSTIETNLIAVNQLNPLIMNYILFKLDKQTINLSHRLAVHLASHLNLHIRW